MCSADLLPIRLEAPGVLQQTVEPLSKGLILRPRWDLRTAGARGGRFNPAAYAASGANPWPTSSKQVRASRDQASRLRSLSSPGRQSERQVATAPPHIERKIIHSKMQKNAYLDAKIGFDTAERAV